jgi:hypothetical protein
MLVGLLALSGCQTQNSDFVIWGHEDCAAGQQWACDLIEAQNKPSPMAHTELGIEA